MAAVGNLAANGSLHTESQKKVKNVAKKSTSKPTRMVNGEKVKMPVSESKGKQTSGMMNGQMKHTGNEERKRAVENSDINKDNDLESSSKVMKISAKDDSDKGISESMGNADRGKAQNGKTDKSDCVKEQEKVKDADATGDKASGNGITASSSSSDKKDAADEESKDLPMLNDSEDVGSVHDEDEALLLSEDEKKDNGVAESDKDKIITKEYSASEKSVEKESAEKKSEKAIDKVLKVTEKQNECNAVLTETKEDEKEVKESSDSGSLSGSTAKDSSVTKDAELETELPEDSGETSDLTKKDNVPADVSGKDSDADKTDTKEKSADSESALDKGNNSELRDSTLKKDAGDSTKTQESEDDAPAAAAADKQDDDGTDGLQLDISADSDCVIHADKDNDKDSGVANAKENDKKASGDIAELNKARDSADLDLEILSDGEEKDKNGAPASKRAASPDLIDDIQPLAKKGRLTSSDTNDDITDQDEVDLSDVTCEEGTVTLPVKVLEAFIQKRIRSYLESHTQSRIIRRVEELQEAVNKWRQVAKTLEKKVKEVSAMRGGLRSNVKAPSRSMAVQCDVVKLQALAQQNQQATQASPAKVTTVPVSTAMVSTPAGLRQLAPNNIAFIQTASGALVAGQNQLQVVNSTASKTVRDLLEQQRHSVQVQVVNNTNASQTVRLPVSQSQQPQAVKGFIDLTDDAGDEKAVKTLQPGTVLITTTGGSSVSGNQVVLQSLNQQIRPQNTVLVSAVPTSQLRGGQVIVQRSPVTIAPTNAVRATFSGPIAPLQIKHPAPLPAAPIQKTPSNVKKLPPPKPSLKISRVQQGIVLSWNMNLTNEYSDITNYQLYAYQEQSGPVFSSLWKRVGDVRALPLPMACTLTQFQEGNKYHFAVRAVDTHGRTGPFSLPNSIHLVANAES